MPINKAEYPTNWQHIRAAKLQEAHHLCQSCGLDGTLTISHLDHDEWNHDVEMNRLAVLCPTCHLKYDRSDNWMRRKYGRHYMKDQLKLIHF
jgi:5-methylcytosine-specific restriction endonuclease McrA